MAAGPRIRELQQVASEARGIKTSVVLWLDSGGELHVELQQTSSSYGAWSHARFLGGGTPGWASGRSLEQTMVQLAQQVTGVAGIDIDSITCSSTKSPVKGKALKELCVRAWHELFGVAPPSDEELAEREQAKKKARLAKSSATRAKRKELLELLMGDGGSVRAWNERAAEAKNVGPFKKVDLSNRDLSGIQLADMPGGNFAGSDLTGAKLRRLNLSKSSFRGAKLSGARLDGANLKRADFTGADLSGANLKGAALAGADFAGANLADIVFEYTSYDEATTFPDGFAGSRGLVWLGQGPNPAALAAIAEEKRGQGPVDLPTFMERLEASVDPKRMKKSLTMLKQSSFELFVDVSDEALTGVVKSQTDPDLVYSCRLAASGAFACCTQNLNPCGGLRGALCKHLILLVVGLAQAGRLDADTLDDWVQRSQLHTPALDKDVMSAVLLKYKGAEAGEIDWRPTETVPEDFYAL